MERPERRRQDAVQCKGRGGKGRTSTSTGSERRRRSHFEVKFTEKKVASLAKTLTNAALTSIFEDLKAGKKITLDSVGKLTPGEADEKGAMAITFKPPQKKKEK